MTKLKVKYLPTGDISEVTPERWERIKNGDFKADFQLIEPLVVPKEVSESLKSKTNIA